MKFDVFSLIPQVFSGYLGCSILNKAIENGLISCGVDTSPSEAIEGILLVAILCITIYSNKLSMKKSDEALLKAKEAEAESA